MARDLSFYEKARSRFASAKSAWSDIREKASYDIRMVSAQGKQWDPQVRSLRENGDNPKPCLEFNTEQNLVQYVANQVRQNRPAIHVNPVSGGATEDTAKIYEGIIRHIQYASQSDVAHDHSVECSASCGFGYYRINAVYVDDATFDQEPRVERILDQMSVYFDADCQQPDFSDAGYCFVRQKLKWDDYRRRFPDAQRIDFEPDGPGLASRSSDWQTEEHVWIAEYWHVEIKDRLLVQLVTGEVGYKDEFEEALGRKLEKTEIANKRKIEERSVHFDLINGVETLEETTWLGKWIPIPPVLGRESVVDGKRELISLVRFIHDAQRLLNTYKSGIAQSIGESLQGQLLGKKGQFKGWQGQNVRNRLYLEFEPTDTMGIPDPAPQLITREPPIQALTIAAAQEREDMKIGANIFDSSSGSEKNETSGIGVQRRVNQADLTNFHFTDNLTRAMWHEGRILLDLIPKMIDTPRAMRILGEDGTVTIAMVHQALGDGTLPMVPGHENEKHHRLDVGLYDVTVKVSKSYNDRFEQNFEMMSQLVPTMGPMFWQLYGDLFFANWQDLPAHKEFADRAKLGLLPAVQQQLGNKQIDPAQLAAMQGQLAMAKQVIDKLLQEKQAKLLELASKERINSQNVARDIVVQGMADGHENTRVTLQAELDTIMHLHDKLHESELAPDPNAQPEPGGTVQ